MNSPEIQVLKQYYASQAASYREFLRLAEQLPDKFTRGVDTQADLDRMRQIMADISTLDDRHANDREQWRRSGMVGDDALKSQIAEVESLIRHVMKHVGDAEAQALAAKQRMTPKISQQSRAAQMRAAYGSARDLT